MWMWVWIIGFLALVVIAAKTRGPQPRLQGFE